jgi:hypothetical protein
MEGSGKQYPYEKTGGLEPGRFKPIEEPDAEDKDPVVFTGLETVWVTVDKVGIPPLGLRLLVFSLTLLLSYIILSWLILLRRFCLPLRNQCLMIWLPFLPGFLLWKLASKGVNTPRAMIRLGGYSPWWTNPSLHMRYGRTR